MAQLRASAHPLPKDCSLYQKRQQASRWQHVDGFENSWFWHSSLDRQSAVAVRSSRRPNIYLGRCGRVCTSLVVDHHRVNIFIRVSQLQNYLNSEIFRIYSMYILCLIFQSFVYSQQKTKYTTKKLNHPGASLSKPHTSVTALRMRVCMLVCLDRLLTVNFKWAHSNISRW